jgi:hypothetical protein
MDSTINYEDYSKIQKVLEDNPELAKSFTYNTTTGLVEANDSNAGLTDEELKSFNSMSPDKAAEYRQSILDERYGSFFDYEPEGITDKEKVKLDSLNTMFKSSDVGYLSSISAEERTQLLIDASEIDVSDARSSVAIQAASELESVLRGDVSGGYMVDYAINNRDDFIQYYEDLGTFDDEKVAELSDKLDELTNEHESDGNSVSAENSNEAETESEEAEAVSADGEAESKSEETDSSAAGANDENENENENESGSVWSTIGSSIGSLFSTAKEFVSEKVLPWVRSVLGIEAEEEEEATAENTAESQEDNKDETVEKLSDEEKAEKYGKEAEAELNTEDITSGSYDGGLENA